MRNWLVYVNSLLTLISIGLFGLTFLAERYIESLARDFVTKKTVDYSVGIVNTAEQAIHSQLAQKILTDKQTQALDEEIAEYRKNPTVYVHDLTGKSRDALQRDGIQEKLAKFVAWKEVVRRYYDNMLARLIFELRIVTGTNVLASALAACWAYLSQGNRSKKLEWMSLLLAASIVYSSLMYVNGLTFFRILFNSRMAWWYPSSVFFMFLGLWVEYGRRASGEDAEHEKRADNAR